MRPRKQDIVLTKLWMGGSTALAPGRPVRDGTVRRQPGDPADPLGGNSSSACPAAATTPPPSRTATAMRQIEALVGTLAMERAMKLYLRALEVPRRPLHCRPRPRWSKALQGRHVDAAFDAFIYGTGKVDDRVSSIKSEDPVAARLPRLWRPAGAGRRQADRQSDDLREKWKKAHPPRRGKAPSLPAASWSCAATAWLRAADPVGEVSADGSQRDMAVTGSGSWQRFVFVGSG